MEREQAKSAIEAVLFTMGGAVELKSLAAAIEDEPEAAKELVEELAAEYDTAMCCRMWFLRPCPLSLTSSLSPEQRSSRFEESNRIMR